MLAIPEEIHRLFCERVEALCRFADTNHDGCLEKDELRTLLTNPYLVSAADKLGIRQKVLGLVESLAAGERGKIGVDEFKEALWRSQQDDDTALNMLMTMHENRHTQAKVTRVKEILESGLQSHATTDSHLAASWAMPDGHTRQLGVSDGGLIKSEPWLAPWTPRLSAAA